MTKVPYIIIVGLLLAILFLSKVIWQLNEKITYLSATKAEGDFLFEILNDTNFNLGEMRDRWSGSLVPLSRKNSYLLSVESLVEANELDLGGYDIGRTGFYGYVFVYDTAGHMISIEKYKP